MTASDLKYEIEQHRHESHFFDRKTMQFFGDRMSNYGVRQTVVKTYDKAEVPVWELYRRRPVKHGLHSSAYFCRTTFRQVFPECEVQP